MDISVLENEKVSEAIVQFVKSGLSNDVIQRIREVYDDETADQVRTIYDMAMDCSVNWSADGMNMDKALAILADFMNSEMPMISPEAKTRLNYCYIMAWK